MGNLKPGATYVYESEGGRIYAREFGSSIRKLIGQNWETPHGYNINDINNMLLMCNHDLDMKQLWEQLWIMYNLKKTHE